MQEENEYPQEEVVVEEEVTTTDDVNEESNDGTVTLSKSEYSKLRRQAIAYKANKETPKPEVKETPTTTNNFSEELIEVKILKSKGTSDEDIQELKALAKVRGKSLLEVEATDPLWKAMLAEREAEINRKKASLPASRGSTNPKPQKSTATPNLSKEDHRALWDNLN